MPPLSRLSASLRLFPRNIIAPSLSLPLSLSFYFSPARLHPLAVLFLLLSPLRTSILIVSLPPYVRFWHSHRRNTSELSGPVYPTGTYRHYAYELGETRNTLLQCFTLYAVAQEDTRPRQN